MHLANYDYEREDVFPIPFFTWGCPFHAQWEKELIEIYSLLGGLAIKEH